jgi:hypothetical protein
MVDVVVGELGAGAVDLGAGAKELLPRGAGVDELGRAGRR